MGRKIGRDSALHTDEQGNITVYPSGTLESDMPADAAAAQGDHVWVDEDTDLVAVGGLDQLKDAQPSVTVFGGQTAGEERAARARPGDEPVEKVDVVTVGDTPIDTGDDGTGPVNRAEQLAAMKNAELEQICITLGIAHTGSNPVLIARILDHEEAED